MQTLLKSIIPKGFSLSHSPHLAFNNNIRHFSWILTGCSTCPVLACTPGSSRFGGSWMPRELSSLVCSRKSWIYSLSSFSLVIRMRMMVFLSLYFSKLRIKYLPFLFLYTYLFNNIMDFSKPTLNPQITSLQITYI